MTLVFSTFASLVDGQVDMLEGLYTVSETRLNQVNFSYPITIRDPTFVLPRRLYHAKHDMAKLFHIYQV